jgi:hypothetical protein
MTHAYWYDDFDSVTDYGQVNANWNVVHKTRSRWLIDFYVCYGVALVHKWWRLCVLNLRTKEELLDLFFNPFICPHSPASKLSLFAG